MNLFYSILFLLIASFSFSSLELLAQDTAREQVLVDSTKTIAQETALSDSISTINKNVSSQTTDSLNSKKTKAKKEPFEHQFRLMLDISHPIGATFISGQYDYEINTDFTLKPDLFAVLELGYGGGKIDYDNLKYKSSNSFVRLGIERSFFDPLYKSDWDMLTIGARYCMALGQRGDAEFTVPNPFGGSASGQIPAQNFFSNWAEITMGLRFEVLPRIYMGWNARIRFNFSADVFNGQVAPNYLAGFGQGDKATSFGFNYYVGYAIRWNKKLFN